MVKAPGASEPETRGGPTGVMMLFDLNKEQLGVLRRSLEARVRDMQQRLGNEPGDEGFRREAMLAMQLLRQVEALEKRAGHRTWGVGDVESLPEDDET
jgi:hypothetical protein